MAPRSILATLLCVQALVPLTDRDFTGEGLGLRFGGLVFRSDCIEDAGMWGVNLRLETGCSPFPDWLYLVAPVGTELIQSLACVGVSAVICKSRSLLRSSPAAASSQLLHQVERATEARENDQA